MAHKFHLSGKLSITAILLSLMAGCATTSDQEGSASQETKPVASQASGSSTTATAQSSGATASAKPNTNQIYFAVPWMRLDPATGRFYMQWMVWPSVNEYLTPQQAPATSTTKP